MAGHIDHGKSTLLGRLLYETGSLSDETAAALAAIADTGGEERAFAYVLDHLAEERSGNITIDTAQVVLRMHGRHYVLIDAPGHKEFVRNMVTGASQADAAMLIVAANEGVREQTRRHLNLLAMIGVRRVIVSVNKMDKVLYSRLIFDHIRGDLARNAGRLGAMDVTFVPMSAQRGENLIRRCGKTPWYTGPTLVEAMAQLRPSRPVRDLLVMPVQDVYGADGGQGTVAGRVESGLLSVGSRVGVYPDGPPAKVEAIETFKGPVTSAGEGWCVGVKLAIDGGGEAIRRGQVIGPADRRLAASGKGAARLFWMSHAPLAEGAKFTLHCATQAAQCTVKAIRQRIDSATLDPIEIGHAPGSSAQEAQYTDIVEAELLMEPAIIHLPFSELPELGRFTLSLDKEVCAGGVFAD